MPPGHVLKPTAAKTAFPPGPSIEEMTISPTSSLQYSSDEEDLPLHMASRQALQLRLELEPYNPKLSLRSRSPAWPFVPPSSPVSNSVASSSTSSSSSESSSERNSGDEEKCFEPAPRGSSSVSCPNPVRPSKKAAEFVDGIIREGKVPWKFYWFTPGKVERFQAEGDEEEESEGNESGEVEMETETK